MRSRFVRNEVALFRHRFETDDVAERASFLRSLEFDWGVVEESEKMSLAKELKTCLWGKDKDDLFKAESWFKVSCPSLLDVVSSRQVPWYTVPDLVGQRKVYIKGGMAYVPQSLQISLVLQAFGAKLEKALEVS